MELIDTQDIVTDIFLLELKIYFHLSLKMRKYQNFKITLLSKWTRKILNFELRFYSWLKKFILWNRFQELLQMKNNRQENQLQKVESVSTFLREMLVWVIKILKTGFSNLMKDFKLVFMTISLLQWEILIWQLLKELLFIKEKKDNFKINIKNKSRILNHKFKIWMNNFRN